MFICTYQAETCLRKIDTSVVIFIRTSPIVKWLYSNSTLAHCDAVEMGGVHFIHYADLKTRNHFWINITDSSDQKR